MELKTEPWADDVIRGHLSVQGLLGQCGDPCLSHLHHPLEQSEFIESSVLLAVMAQCPTPKDSSAAWMAIGTQHWSKTEQPTLLRTPNSLLTGLVPN